MDDAVSIFAEQVGISLDGFLCEMERIPIKQERPPGLLPRMPVPVYQVFRYSLESENRVVATSPEKVGCLPHLDDADFCKAGSRFWYIPPTVDEYIDYVNKEANSGNTRYRRIYEASSRRGLIKQINGKFQEPATRWATFPTGPRSVEFAESGLVRGGTEIFCHAGLTLYECDYSQLPDGVSAAALHHFMCEKCRYVEPDDGDPEATALLEKRRLKGPDAISTKKLADINQYIMGPPEKRHLFGEKLDQAYEEAKVRRDLFLRIEAGDVDHKELERILPPTLDGSATVRSRLAKHPQKKREREILTTEKVLKNKPSYALGQGRKSGKVHPGHVIGRTVMRPDSDGETNPMDEVMKQLQDKMAL